MSTPEFWILISNLILLDKWIEPYAANHDQVHKQLYLKTYKI